MTEPVEILRHAPERPAVPAATAEPAATAGPAGHACGCHEHDDAAPVLDVRSIPHAIRHATVLGAFDAIPPGGALVVVAPHRPLPLLAQLAERAPIDVAYLVDGPDAWHVQITRRAPAAA